MHIRKKFPSIVSVYVRTAVHRATCVVNFVSADMVRQQITIQMYENYFIGFIDDITAIVKHSQISLYSYLYISKNP